MTTDIARRQESALAAPAPTAPLQRLDPYGAGGIASQAGRIAPLAVVSLGFRQAPRKEGELGLPRATRRDDKEWLHLHDPDGRALGLKAALEAGQHRRLQIAFPMDRGFIQQSFTRWSASALEIYGDANGLYLIDGRDPKNPEHRFIPPEHPEFPRLVKTCKAETRVYFALARWVPGEDGGEPQSEVLFPDGFGFYVFRTAGRHTAANIFGYLESISSFTHGRIAGIPFDLEVLFPEVVGPDGKKRTVPTATIVVRPPESIKLNSRTFRQLATAGLEEGRNLQLPALPTPEDLAIEGPPVIEDVPDDALERLAAGDFPCDYNLVVRTWHAIVRGTPLESDESRAIWLRGWSNDEFDSLTAVRRLTQREATQLLADLADGVSDVREELDRARDAERAAEYDRIFGRDDDGTAYADQPRKEPPKHDPPAEADGPESAPSGSDERAPEQVDRVEATAARQVRPTGEADQGVVGVRSAIADRLGELHEEAARLDIYLTPFKVQYPAKRELVIRTSERLQDAIDAVKKRLAGATIEQPAADSQLPF